MVSGWNNRADDDGSGFNKSIFRRLVRGVDASVILIRLPLFEFSLLNRLRSTFEFTFIVAGQSIYVMQKEKRDRMKCNDICKQIK